MAQCWFPVVILLFGSAVRSYVPVPRRPSLPCQYYSSCSTTATSTTRATTTRRRETTCLGSLPSWHELESDVLPPTATATPTRSIDSVLQPEKPTFSTTYPTLFRERHGWCPYSERVWLALELLDVEYDTVRIDNTGGGRPSYFSGQTPQMKWPDTDKMQGESWSLVAQVDQRYGEGGTLRTHDDEVQHAMAQFRHIFPQRARPSSRAAFLFRGNGEPLWRSTFEETLEKTNEFLASGPFLGSTSSSSRMTAADLCWAPFLERYRYQLPCLHEGLDPFDAQRYPHLHAWYQAMDQVPAYACRVKGDASSWRKVLTMAGFGNAGVPPQISQQMQDLQRLERQSAANLLRPEIWSRYAATRPHVAPTPQAEAAAIVLRNRHAILRDVAKRAASWDGTGLPTTETEMENAMKGLVLLLLDADLAEKCHTSVGAMAAFLDERMCVPRDMGAMSAAAMKRIANEYYWQS